MVWRLESGQSIIPDFLSKQDVFLNCWWPNMSHFCRGLTTVFKKQTLQWRFWIEMVKPKANFCVRSMAYKVSSGQVSSACTWIWPTVFEIIWHSCSKRTQYIVGSNWDKSGNVVRNLFWYQLTPIYRSSVMNNMYDMGRRSYNVLQHFSKDIFCELRCCHPQGHVVSVGDSYQLCFISVCWNAFHLYPRRLCRRRWFWFLWPKWFYTKWYIIVKSWIGYLSHGHRSNGDAIYIRQL